MHPLLEQYQHTLLGRLRTKLLTGISGSIERLPTDRELYSDSMAEWKENANAARIKFFLLHLRETHQVSVPEHLSRQQVRASIREIAKKPPLFGLFTETTPEDDPNDEPSGCLVMGHTRPNDEPGYYVAVMSEAGFPNLGFISIVPSKHASDSLISQLADTGWEDLSFAEAGQNPAVCMGLTSLQQNLPGTVNIPIEQIKTRSKDEPPLDPECMRPLELVLRGKMRNAKAVVRLRVVRLFDENFGLGLDPEDIARWAKHLQKGDDDLLVYWDGESFISSDDYYGYL